MSVHIPALDGVRGVAVLLVMYLHFCQLYTGAPGAVFASLIRICSIGQSGVDLFFVLSGFLITGILLDSKGTPHFLRNFYLRRILRIFPLYYGFLAVMYCVGPMLGWWSETPVAEQLWFWSYLQNVAFTFFPHSSQYVGHFWSLAVEEHFYLFWPLLVHHFETVLLRRMLWLFAGGSVLIRILLIWSGYDVFYFTLCRLDGLALGALLAIAYRSKAGYSWLPVHSSRTWLAAGLALTVLYLATTGSRVPIIQVVKSTVLATVCSGILILALSPAGSVNKVCNLAALRSLGKYSYGLYVFHPVVFLWCNRALDLRHPLLALPVQFGLTYVIAVGVWHIWERPFLSWKAQFKPLKSVTEKPTAAETGEACPAGIP